MKLPGVISLRKALADLPDAEGQLAPHRLEHVVEVDEDALRGLRAQVGDRGVLLDRPHEGLEHQVELARRRQLALAAVGAEGPRAPQWEHASPAGIVNLLPLVAGQ